jgi:hypothetical protein
MIIASLIKWCFILLAVIGWPIVSSPSKSVDKTKNKTLIFETKNNKSGKLGRRRPVCCGKLKSVTSGC